MHIEESWGDELFKQLVFNPRSHFTRVRFIDSQITQKETHRTTDFNTCQELVLNTSELSLLPLYRILSEDGDTFERDDE